MPDAFSPEAGPYLLAAVICERVLREDDGTLSAIRLVDTVSVPPLDSSREPAAGARAWPLCLVVSFRGGGVGSRHRVAVIAHAPSGATEIVVESELESSTRVDEAVPGFDMVGELELSPGSRGTYWFEITLDGAGVTAVPLTVVRELPGPPPTSPAPA